MRYYLSRRFPSAERILLVESGSRALLEGLLPSLRETWAITAPIDLVTCYPTLPQGFPPDTQVYRVYEHRGRDGRRQLFRELARQRYSHLGIICSGEPLMTKWKWALALRLPAKVFIVNENGDYFWLDRDHFGLIREIIFLRSGLQGAGAVRILAELFCFPFTLTYLLLYAATVHARRALRGG